MSSFKAIACWAVIVLVLVLGAVQSQRASIAIAELANEWGLGIDPVDRDVWTPLFWLVGMITAVAVAVPTVRHRLQFSTEYTRTGDLLVAFVLAEVARVGLNAVWTFLPNDCIGAVLMVAYLRWQQRPGIAETMGLRERRFCRTLTIGVLAGFLLSLRHSGASVDGLIWMKSDLRLVFMSPVAEELVYRGVLHQYLRSRLSSVWAIIVGAGLFGAAHYPLSGALWAASGGVCYGFLREWRGGLWSPIAAHMVNNALWRLV